MLRRNKLFSHSDISRHSAFQSYAHSSQFLFCFNLHPRVSLVSARLDLFHFLDVGAILDSFYCVLLHISYALAYNARSFNFLYTMYMLQNINKNVLKTNMHKPSLIRRNSRENIVSYYIRVFILELLRVLNSFTMHYTISHVQTLVFFCHPIDNLHLLGTKDPAQKIYLFHELHFYIKIYTPFIRFSIISIVERTILEADVDNWSAPFLPLHFRSGFIKITFPCSTKVSRTKYRHWQERKTFKRIKRRRYIVGTGTCKKIVSRMYVTDSLLDFHRQWYAIISSNISGNTRMYSQQYRRGHVMLPA